EELDVLRLPAEEEAKSLPRRERAVVLDKGAAHADVEDQSVLAIEERKDRLGKPEALKLATIYSHCSGRIYKAPRQAYCCVCRNRKNRPEDSMGDETKETLIEQGNQDPLHATRKPSTAESVDERTPPVAEM